MIFPLLLIALLCALIGSCSLIHQDIPNEAPVLTISQIDTLQVRRGGQVKLRVQATDADDDKLFYHWTAFGAGSFRDSTAEGDNTWFAPQEIQGNSEQFVLQVTIRDRFCAIIPVAEDRQRCEQESQLLMQTFVVEVVQRPPILRATPDTTLSFRAPAVALDAFAEDPDGDVLDYRWSQLEGPDLRESIERVDPSHTRYRFIPFFPGDYRFRVEADDGSDTVAVDIAVRLEVPELPEGGMVSLSLDSGHEYAMDVYEYPNRRGEKPQLATFFGAARLCAAQGKRLCQPVEWERACAGEQNSPYSSPDSPGALGQDFGLRFCNAPGSDFAGDNPDPEEDRAPSGSFPNCSGESGVYDLTGNVREWVGRINVFGLWQGSTSVSDVIALGPCGAFSELPAIEVEDLDITDPDIEGKIPTTYAAYLREFGFRCCR